MGNRISELRAVPVAVQIITAIKHDSIDDLLDVGVTALSLLRARTVNLRKPDSEARARGRSQSAGLDRGLAGSAVI